MKKKCWIVVLASVFGEGGGEARGWGEKGREGVLVSACEIVLRCDGSAAVGKLQNKKIAMAKARTGRDTGTGTAEANPGGALT